MFGNLKLQRCLAAPETYHLYRSYYCGLCHQLAQGYGLTARMVLNYDLTFYYILLSSLAKRPAESKKVRCPVTPGHRKDVILTPKIGDLAAAVNIYLAGMKLRDDILDEHHQMKRVIYRFYRPKEMKAGRVLAQYGLDSNYAEMLFNQQQQMEKTKCSLADLCRPTEEGLKYLFSEGGRLLGGQSDPEILGKLGAALGRIIYILDSFLDLPTDYRCHRFNALADALWDQPAFELNLPERTRTRVIEVLQSSLREARELMADLSNQQEDKLLATLLCSLERRIEYLVVNTKTLAELEAKVKTGSFSYLLTHPRHLLKSRTAARYYREDRSCCGEGCNLCTMAACCDAADCDCDTAEFCLSGGNPCELLECFFCG